MSLEAHPENEGRPPRGRVFFALQPPATLAGALADVARQLAEHHGGRPAPCATIHLTLAFLGPIPAADLVPLQTLAERIRSVHFSLRIDRLGCWPNKRLLWAGMSSVPEALGELHRQLTAALTGAGYRTDSAVRGLTPHITLVRHLPTRIHDLENGGALQPLDWLCQGFSLLRSDVHPSGASNVSIQEYPLT